MPYKIYYGNTRVKIYNDNHLYNMMHYTKERHIWPEDDTEITLTYSDNIISYTISNLSDRTQYLYDNGLLGLGVFVEENYSWMGKKMRSDLTKSNHATWRNVHVIPITSLSGSIRIDAFDHPSYCAISKQLTYPFNYSAQYQEPYVDQGTETLKIGLGRYYDWNNGFRPHVISNTVSFTVYNPN